MNKISSIFLILLFLVCCFSCKKETNDNQPPVITINSPKANQSFGAIGTIKIEAMVADNEKLTSVYIALRDANNINVGNTISLSPNSKSINLSEELVLTDKYLKSGFYTLKVSANDGENQTDKYVDISITEFQRSRNGLVVFSNSGFATEITKLNNSFNSSLLSSVSGDFLDGALNSYNQQVLSCGNVSGNLISFDVLTATQSWNVNNLNAGFPYFTSFAQHQNEVFVGYYNRDIKSFNQHGNQSFSAQAFVNSYVKKLYVHQDNLLITAQHEISGGTSRLVVYYLSGFMKDNMVLNEDVRSFFSFSTNEIVLFSNAFSTGKLLVYNILTNATWQPFALSAGEITSATEISNGVYLVTQNGNINLVNLNTYTTSVYLSGINAQLVKYDAVTNEVVAACGNILKSFDYSTKTLKNSHTSSNQILAFDFWYNK